VSKVEVVSALWAISLSCDFKGGAVNSILGGDWLKMDRPSSEFWIAVPDKKIDNKV